jgi:2-iminobutanoate/2-iminopropanoate deaminase
MTKPHKINTSEASKSIGAYSQGVKIQANSSLIFVSGQLPVNPTTGALISGGIKEMTAQIMANILSILKAGGSDLKHAVKIEVFLTNLDDFKLMNEEYSKYFDPGDFPARQTVEVSRLPLNAPIEISCIAVANV